MIAMMDDSKIFVKPFHLFMKLQLSIFYETVVFQLLININYLHDFASTWELNQSNVHNSFLIQARAVW